MYQAHSVKPMSLNRFLFIDIIKRGRKSIKSINCSIPYYTSLTLLE